MASYAPPTYVLEEILAHINRPVEAEQHPYSAVCVRIDSGVIYHPEHLGSALSGIVTGRINAAIQMRTAAVHELTGTLV